MQKYFIDKMIMCALNVNAPKLANRVGVTKATINNYINGKPISKTLQRCINWELDSLINECTSQKIKDFCEELKTKRDD